MSLAAVNAGLSDAIDGLTKTINECRDVTLPTQDIQDRLIKLRDDLNQFWQDYPELLPRVVEECITKNEWIMSSDAPEVLKQTPEVVTVRSLVILETNEYSNYLQWHRLENLSWLFGVNVEAGEEDEED